MDEVRESANYGDFKQTGDGKLLLGLPDDVDVLIELKDWLFALEGVEEISDRLQSCHLEGPRREERCWHTTFENILDKAKSTPKHLPKSERNPVGKQKYPVEMVTVGMEGLQILKPMNQKVVMVNGLTENGFQQKEKTCGVNAEVDIVISEDDTVNGMEKWVLNNLKFSVKEPIEAVVTKDELQHLAFLCKTEVESMGRIVAGVLRILKLEGSIGTAAISQLSNLGNEGLDSIFTPEKLSRGSTPRKTGLGQSSNLSLEATLSSLEDMVLKSQVTCAALSSSEATSAASSKENVRQLMQKLESMQELLMQLRTQI